MKKIALMFATMLCAGVAYAQNVPEPEFIGEVIIADMDKAQYRTLPKERASKRTVNAFNSITTRLILNPVQSPLELSDRDNYSIIIKAENNDYDPRSLFQVFKFALNMSNERYVELGSGIIGGYVSNTETNTKAYVPFTAKKYGESSYILTFPITPGEYGIITDTHDDSYQIISTFSIYKQSDIDEMKRREAEKALEEMQKLEAALKKQAAREAKKNSKKNK